MPVQRPETWDWRQLASLGEQLRAGESLLSQRDRIIAMAGRFVEGVIDVWLQEKAFRLPDWEPGGTFPDEPELGGMKLALKSGKTVVQNKPPRGKSASRRAVAAIPLEDHGFLFGIIQVTRPKGPAFTADEINLLEGFAQIAAVGLFAAHRAAVEQFRLRQFNLVRDVSAQIALVMNVDELARRVTELIQTTFNFYYVAIFTHKPEDKSLRFRASAVAPRKGRKKASIPLEVELGQGLIGEAAKTGIQIVCPDVQQDPRYRFIDALPETRSEVVIPLKVEDRILGALDVQSNQPDAFHPIDLLILNALADNIARAVESARLYHGLRRRANQLALVADVSNIVTSTLNLTQLMRESAKLIHEKFGYPHVSLFTVHPNRRLVMYEAGSGNRSKRLEGYTIPLDAETGIMPWVARHGETVLLNDVTKDPRYTPSPLPPENTQSELCVPLTYGGKVLGLLDIQSDRLNAFTAEDQAMFETVADTIAAAIRNADLYRSEQWRRQTSDSLRDVAGLISSNAGMEEVLESILAELDRNLPVDVSAIWLLEDDELCLSAVHGIDPDALEAVCIAHPESAYAMAEALMSDVPVIRKPNDPAWPMGLAAGYDSNYSSIIAPLRVGDRALGLLTLSHHTSGRYGHEAHTITSTFASYAAVAIENARLYDAAQEQAYASAALLQVAQAVVSLNDLNEILGSIIRIMPILVGVQRAVLYRWDPLSEKFMASQEYGFSEEEEAVMTEQQFSHGDFPVLDHVCKENGLLVWPLESGAAPGSWLQIQPGAGAEADVMTSERLLIGVPLSIKNDIFGVLLVEEAENARRFRSRRIEIINGIAQQAALAIQNDLLQQEMVVRERLETEVQLARQIQQTFIPQHLPQLDEWHIAARWRTARQVGGDFYDVIELPGRKLGLFIADVADKGVPAALFMALTRTLVRAAVFETHSPAQALSRVNDQLLPDTQQGMFVTAVYGVLDLEQNTFTYVNAGHNPPFWVRADGSIEKLTRTGVALGVMEQPAMNERTISLVEEETLLLYTDGLTETYNPQGEFYGEERLLHVLRANGADSADEVLSKVEASLNDFSDPLPPADDLTMLAVRRLRQA